MYSLNYKVTTSACDSEGRLKLYSAAPFVEEHHEIHRHISNLTFLIYFTLVRNDSRNKYIVLRNLKEVIESTMHRIILTRLNLYRMSTHRLVVVNQIIYLTLLAVVVSNSLRCMI